MLLASQHSHLLPSDFSRCAVSGDTAVCVVLQGCLSFLLSVVSPNSQNNCFQKFLSQHYLPLELHKVNTSLVHSPHHMRVPTVSVCAFSVGSRFKRYDHLVCYFCLSVYTFYIYMNWNQWGFPFARDQLGSIPNNFMSLFLEFLWFCFPSWTAAGFVAFFWFSLKSKGETHHWVVSVKPVTFSGLDDLCTTSSRQGVASRKLETCTFHVLLRQ